MPVYCLGISLSLLWIPKSPIYYLSPSPGHTAHRSQRPYLNLLLNLKSLNGLQLLLHFPVVLSWPHKSYADTSLTISDVFKRNRGCQKEKKKIKDRKKKFIKVKAGAQIWRSCLYFYFPYNSAQVSPTSLLCTPLRRRGREGGGVGQGLTSRH